MANALDSILNNQSRTYLTDAELAILLNGTADSRYSKVKRMLAQGKLLHIRRGLYCINNVSGHLLKPHPFELAQQIYGPSYISLESALSFHQLIPEAVYTITSVTSKRAKEFKTPLGLFSYLHVPQTDLYVEVERVEEGRHVFFIAKPWKAICDYVFCYRKNWTNLQPMLTSLRINEENLPSLSYEERQLLEDYYQHRRITRFLKEIMKECKVSK